MSRNHFRGLAAASVALLLSWGILRATTSEHEERWRKIRVQCATEQRRLGITDQGAFAKYPTPEITLCRLTRVLPGGAGEVLVKGKFAPGTKFVFLTNTLEVVKEAVTATDYRASIKAAQGLGPGLIDLHPITPVSCGYALCRAVYVGGKYEWDFTADNGWRIKLKILDEGFAGKEKGFTSKAGDETPDPQHTYRAEFYQGDEPTPFAVGDVEVRLSAVTEPASGNYEGQIVEGQLDVNREAERQEMGEAEQISEEEAAAHMKIMGMIWERFTEKERQMSMNGDRLSEKERQQLLAVARRAAEQIRDKVSAKERELLTRYLKELSQPMKTTTPREEPAGSPEAMQRKKMRELGCYQIRFERKPEGVKGWMECQTIDESGGRGEGVTVNLKGTMKYLGP